tara:strand:- start:4733 stop:6118 length:1386 start_codon:yes stop_codon:yes gene_type:complete
MAKKQSTTPRINYGPDTALIMGEGQVARSEAAKTMLPTMAFTEGFEKTFSAVFKEQQQEQEKRDAIREAAMIDLGGVQNINKLTEGYNKQQVTDFVRGKRDEYAKLSDLYQKTKDPNILDKMDAIKFSFQNLNQQLNGLVNERREYLDAFDKKQIIDLPKDSIYTMAYTNNGQFEIGDNGDVGFNIDGKSSLLKDIAGKWNVKNNIYGAHAMQSYMNSVSRGEKNTTFYPDIEKNKTLAILRQGGPEGVQTATKSDFDFDDDYKLPNGQLAGKMTFENMFKSGILADKFYDGSLTGVVYGTKGKDGIWNTSETGGSDWFWNNENSKDLSNLVAEFTTDVNQTGWNQGNANYKPKTPRGGQSGKLNLGKSRFTNESIYVEQRFVNNKLQEFNNAKKGDFISGFEGANTYGFKVDENGNFIYQEYNPETGKFEGDKKFNRDNAITQFIPSHYLGGGSKPADNL